MEKIKVLIAEDHDMVREGLRVLLESGGDIEIAAEAKSGREAVDKTIELRPDIVLMDIAMPQLNGLQAAQQILKSRPKSRVLMLSAHGDPEYVEQAVLMGANGYLLKQNSSEILAKAVREVSQGKLFFSSPVSKHLREQYLNAVGKTGLIKKPKNRLTSREKELLQLIAEGSVNKQIAAELGISIKTVEKHRQNLMAKLNIHEIAGLTRYAIAAGVIESSVQKTTV